jgi:hypothetical protein
MVNIVRRIVKPIGSIAFGLTEKMPLSNLSIHIRQGLADDTATLVKLAEQTTEQQSKTYLYRFDRTVLSRQTEAMLRGTSAQQIRLAQINFDHPHITKVVPLGSRKYFVSYKDIEAPYGAYLADGVVDFKEGRFLTREIGLGPIKENSLSLPYEILKDARTMGTEGAYRARVSNPVQHKVQLVDAVTNRRKNVPFWSQPGYMKWARHIDKLTRTDLT